MPGKVFDLDEPNPQKALEVIRQAVNSGREVNETLILDVLTTAGVEMEQDSIVSQLILDALDAELRADGQDEVVGQLILDALDAQLRAAGEEQRNSEQDDAINLLILDALTGGGAALEL